MGDNTIKHDKVLDAHSAIISSIFIVTASPDKYVYIFILVYVNSHECANFIYCTLTLLNVTVESHTFNPKYPLSYA